MVVFTANGRGGSFRLSLMFFHILAPCTPWLIHFMPALSAGGPLGFNEKYILYRSDPSAFWNQSEKVLPQVRPKDRQFFTFVIRYIHPVNCWICLGGEA